MHPSHDTSATDLPQEPNPFLADKLPDITSDLLSDNYSAQVNHEITPPSSPNAYGALVVKQAIHDSFKLAGTTHTEEANRDQAILLKRLRQTYCLADRQNKDSYGEILLSENVPEWLLQPFGGKNVTPSGLIDAIVGAHSINGTDSHDVANDSVLNLLQWHNHVQGEKQKAYEVAVTAPMRERFLERIQKAENNGWLKPGTVSPERIDLIKNVPVYLDDGMGLDKHFQSLTNATAYAQKAEDNERPFIVLSLEAVKQPFEKREKVFTHEMVHILAGLTPQPFSPEVGLDEMQAQLEHSGEYGLHRVFGNNKVGNGVEEAVTEHFARALISGNIDKLQPLGGAYREYRYLLRSLCKRGVTPIDPRLFVQAMFADTPHAQPGVSDSEPEDVSALRLALTKAFPGRNISQEMTRQIDAAAEAGRSVLGPIIRFSRNRG